MSGKDDTLLKGPMPIQGNSFTEVFKFFQKESKVSGIPKFQFCLGIKCVTVTEALSVVLILILQW